MKNNLQKASCYNLVQMLKNSVIILLMLLALSFNSNSQTVVSVTPSSTTGVGNCYPFGGTTYYGAMMGFIYRNVPAFSVNVGDKIRFDMGAVNPTAVKRNIYFSAANINPAAYSGTTQNVTATGWVQMVPETQTPLNPNGNTIQGDYELTYTATSSFTFGGGGFIIAFGGTPPGTYSDANCAQVDVITNSSDASGMFYKRFYSTSFLYSGVLDASGDNSSLIGFKIDATSGAALNFDGVNDQAVITNPYYQFSKEITVEWWVNPASFETLGSGIGQATSGVDVMSSNVWLMHFNGTGTSMNFYVNDGGNWRTHSSVNIPLGWHHVVGVADANSTRLYIDGVLQSSGAGISGTILNNSSSQVHFGKDVRYNTGRFMNGSIDEVRIWSRALCVGEIQNNMNCEIPTTGTGLVGNYHFNQGVASLTNSSVTTLNDASGNSRNASLSGFALTGSTSNWISPGGVSSGTSCSAFVAPSITASSNSAVTVGGSLNLTATSGFASYTWTGPNGFTSTSQNPTITNVTTAAAGSYSVTGTNSLGCSNTSSTSVTVNNPATALSFEGTSDYVDLGTPLAANASYTKEGWIYSTDANSLNNLFSTYQDPIYIPSGKINVGQGGSYSVIADPDAFPMNVWTHVAITYNQPTSTLKLYVNGILKASTNSAPAFVGGQTFLGQHPLGGGQSSVRMDEVRLWSRALSQCEILNNMNCELNPTGQTGLARLFHFNQGGIGISNSTVNTLTDATGNGNGTLVNFALAGSTSNWIAGNVSSTACSAFVAPTISASSNTPVTSGGSLNLTALNGFTSYSWTGPNGFTSTSQNPTITNIATAAAGTYTVTGSNSNGCSATSTTTVSVLLDTDGDGIADINDLDADNDGILNTAECNTSNFYWSNPPSVSGNNATGTIHGIAYTYTSSQPVSTTTYMYGNNVFPASYNVPNSNPTIQNIYADNNTITFASPMTNPVLVFASIGQSGLSVPIQFSAPIQLVWSQNVVQNSTTQITGTEGYAIVRLMGTFTSISFNYLTAENWCNFAFGADFQSCGDADNDGTPNYLDTDSDNDGCPDAIEGSLHLALSQTQSGMLTGSISNTGIPTLAGTGQGIGTSENYAANCFCQPFMDKIAPSAVAKNLSVNLNASGIATITASQINNGSSDNCSITSMTVSPSSFNCANVGANTVTLTVTDSNSNTSTATAIVTVADNIAPTITCATNVNANSSTTSCDASVTVPSPTASDNCNTFVIPTAPFSASSSNLMLWIDPTKFNNSVISDASGYSRALTTNATYEAAGFNNLPSVRYNNNQTATNTAFPITNNTYVYTTVQIIGATNSWASIFYHANRDNGLTIEQNGVTGSNIYHWQTGNDNSNVNQTVTFGTSYIMAAKIENGNARSFTLYQKDANGNLQSLGTITNSSYTVGLYNGQLYIGRSDVPSEYTNMRMGEFVYFQNALPSGVTESSIVNYLFNKWLTTPPSVSLTNSFNHTANASGTYPIGNTTVTWTATDASGNSSTCNQTVTVTDNVAPSVVTKAASVYLDANGSASITASQVDNGSTDNCGVASVSVSPTTFNCSNTTSTSSCSTYGLTFNGSNYVTGSDINFPSGNSPRTIEGWVKFTSTSYGPILGYGNDANTGQAFGLGVHGGIGKAYFYSQNTDVAGNTLINNGAWHHIAVTYDGTTIKMYVDGNLDVSQVVSLNTIRTGSFYIAHTQNHSSYNLTGSTDETRLWSFAKTQAQIQASMNSCLSGSESGLIAYFPFNEGSGTATADKQSSHSHNGTLYNNPSWISGATGLSSSSAGTTATLTVTDIHGNSSTGTATVLVIDTIKPVVVAKADTVTLQSNGSVSITANDLVSSSSDNCSVSSITASQTTFTNSNVGDNTVTVTATDASGNTSSVTTNVYVIEPAPHAICKAKTVYLNASGSASIVANDIDNGSYSLVGLSNKAVSKSTFDCSNVGTNNVWLIVTSNFGKKDSCQATVTVEDNIAPSATAKNVTIQLNASGAATVSATQVDNGSSDNCSIASMSLSKTSFDCSNVGANSDTLTVTDVNGNVSTAVATVTVEDNIAPTATAKNVTIQLNASGAATVSATQFDNGSSDNCSIASMSLSKTSYDCSNVGANSDTLTVTDVNGNVSTAVATVTVEDNIAPTATAKNVTIQLNASGAATVSATQVDNGSSDNCSIASMSLSKTSFDCSNVGENSDTLTVTDVNGNVSTAVVTVSVQDTIAPAALAKNVTIQLDASGAASITASQVDNGSSDNCSVATLSVSPNTFDCSNVNVSSSATQTIVTNNTWMESTSSTPSNICSSFWNGVSSLPSSSTYTKVPVINSYSVNVVPGTQGLFALNDVRFYKKTFNLSSISGIKATLLASVDNAVQIYINGVAVALEGSLDGANFADANYSRVVLNSTGSNVNGGVGYQSYDNITTSNASSLFVVGTNEIVLAVSNCGGGDRGAVSFKAIIETSASTSNPVTLTVTDVNGNVSTATATVTVQDNIKPTVVTQPVTVQLNASGAASITPSQINNGSTDNCSIASYSLDKTSFTCANVGSNTVTLTVTDVNGNVSSATATVTVEDKIAPTATAKNVTIQLNASGAATVSASQVDNGSSDNCSIANMSLSKTSFDCSNVGANTDTLTVTDANGNVSKTVATVTVQDNIAPTATAKNVTIQLNASGAATVSASQVDNGSSDNCSIASMSLSKTSYDCSNVGANSVTLTVTDVNGNVSTATSTVTVQDNIAPTAIAKNVDIYLDANGAASTTVAAVNNGSYDNCSVATTTLSKYNFNCSNVGANTDTLAVTDVNGNVSKVTATVTVHDNIAPTAIAKNVTVTLSAGAASITAAQVNNGSYDNCSVATMSVSPNTFTCSNIGNNTVTLTVTDVNGNVSTTTSTVNVVGAIPTASISQGVQPGFTQGGAVVLTASSPTAVAYNWTSGPATPVYNVYATGVYTVTVTNTYGCTANASSSVNYNASNLLSSYTIISKNEVHFEDHTTLYNGGIGVTNTTGDDGEVEFENYSNATATGTFVRAKNIESENNSTITTKILTAAPATLVPAFLANPYCGNNSCSHSHHGSCSGVSCTNTHHMTCVGGLNRNISANSTVVITDSILGQVVVGSNATVTFTSSRIYMKGLQLNTGSHVNFTQCAVVKICNGLNIQNGVSFNTTNSSIVSMYVGNEVNVNQGSSVTANIYSQGDIHFKGSSATPTVIKGMIIGDEIEAESYVNFYWNTNTSCTNNAYNKTGLAANESGENRNYFEANVYPNPAVNSFNVRLFSSSTEAFDVEVYDMTGKLIESTKVFESTLSQEMGSDYKAGIYIVRITQGDNTSTVKVVKVN